MFVKIAAVALAIAVTVPAVYIAVPPGPPPAGPSHQFVDSGDGDSTCDLHMIWRDNRGKWHSQCDQRHLDPYNVPSHVKRPDGSIWYMGPGVKAENNYH